VSEWHQEFCAICTRALEVDEDSGVTGGAEFRGSPGYGSRFDSMLNVEESLYLIICDVCLPRVCAVVRTEREEFGPVVTRSEWPDEDAAP